MSSTSVAILFSLLFKHSHPEVPLYSHARKSAALVVFLIIDQFYLEKGRGWKCSTKLTLVTFAWAWASLLINSSYKGHLVSILTTPILPSVPHNIYELAESEDLIITTTTTTSLSNGGRIIPDISWRISKFIELCNDTTTNCRWHYVGCSPMSPT